jgi:hypothetical protein
MHLIAKTPTTQPPSTPAHTDTPLAPSGRYSRFAAQRGGSAGPTARSEIDRVDDEFTKWLGDNDQPLMVPTRDGTSSREETVLEFWRRKSNEAGYECLPKVVRVLLAAPSSSSQIERDFGDTGMMVAKSQSCLSAANVEMSSFMKANKDFVVIKQVAELKKKEAENQKPRITEVDLNAMINENVDVLLNDGFSSINVSSETFEDYYRHGHDF